MNLETIEGTIKEVVGEVSGLDTVWEDEPRPMTNPETGAICLLNWTTIRGRGVDDRIKLQDLNLPQGEELADQYRGLREGTLTIKVEAHWQLSNDRASHYLEKVRDRIQWRGYRARLRAAGIGLARVGSPVAAPEIRDDRRLSIAAVEVILNLVVTEEDPNRYGYVATVEIDPQVH